VRVARSRPSAPEQNGWGVGQRPERGRVALIVAQQDGDPVRLPGRDLTRRAVQIDSPDGSRQPGANARHRLEGGVAGLQNGRQRSEMIQEGGDPSAA